VRAVAVSEQEEAERARDNRKDEDRLLLALYENAERSQRDLARACAFMLKTGEPGISKVQRVADRLKAVKLVKNGRGARWKLTKEGESNAKKLKGAEDEQRVEDRGGTASSKPFSAVKGRKCSKEVPCIQCHVADGNVYKIKDGRLRKALCAIEAEASLIWSTRSPSPVKSLIVLTSKRPRCARR
jgi:hypothetical protein